MENTIYNNEQWRLIGELVRHIQQFEAVYHSFSEDQKLINQDLYEQDILEVKKEYLTKILQA